MDSTMLRADIRRKLDAYGYALVNRGTLRQALRPTPETLEVAGQMLTNGEPGWIAEIDPVGDRVVIRHRGGVE